MNTADKVHGVSPLTVYYQNVRSIVNKISYLKSNLHTLLVLPDILAFTETWLNSNINSEELSLYQFNIYRKDRDTTNINCCRGGGVLLAINKNLKSKLIDTSSFRNVEQLFVELILNNNTKLLIGLVYFQPSATLLVYDEFCSCINELHNKYINHEFVILGDFNLPNALWFNTPLRVTVNGYLPPHKIEVINELIDTLSLLDLHQLYPVHYKKKYTLDLLFAKNNLISINGNMDNLLNTDMHHTSLIFNIESQVAESQRLMYRNFKIANYNGIKQKLLNLNWSDFYNLNNIDLKINQFYNNLNSVIKEYVPLKVVKPSSYPKWYDKELIRLINDKKRQHKLFKMSNSMSDYIEFKRLRSLCICISRKRYRGFINQVQLDLNRNPKSFWHYINSLNKEKSIPNYVTFNSIDYSDDVVIANAFADYFKEFFIVQDTSFSPDNSNLDLLSNIVITLDDLKEAVKSMKMNCNSGPDNIPSYFIINCFDCISAQILDIFNLSLQSGIFPTYWKKSFINPIHKSGSKFDVKNYRPVTTISCLPKLLDYIVTTKMTDKLLSYFALQQHGFIKYRSTLSNLLLFSDYIYNAFRDNTQVDAIYTDMSKAFDSVNFELLILKLNCAGIKGSLLSWINSYINGRTQIVKIRNSYSYEFKILSGVPQGSHLGPLLFTIFINDLVKVVKYSEIVIYADDVKIYKTIRSINDCMLLQVDLNNISKWINDCGLCLNVKKCNSISFSRNVKIKYDYQVFQVLLNKVSYINDLGITFDDTLSFDEHRRLILSKANRTLGFIIRSTKDFNNTSTIITLFKSLILSKFNYCSQIWAPQYNNQIYLFQKLQNKFLRYIAFKSFIPMGPFDHNYSKLFIRFNLLPMCSHFIYNDTLLAYRIINNLIDINHAQFFEFRTQHYELRNQRILLEERSHSNFIFNCPKFRLRRLWNKLSDEIKTVGIGTFKSLIKEMFMNEIVIY